jgi:hypothetical protein
MCEPGAGTCGSSTALTTVRPVSPWTRRVDVAALTVAVGLALVEIVGGVRAFNSPRGFLNGVPIRRPSRRAAPGAPSVANVLRVVHRGRIVLLDP